MKNPPLPFRVGHGYDIHRLRPGGELKLAGVTVSREISPEAHSDGDVLFHALVDAILGAIGAGDIGQLFPNTDPKYKNAPSILFLKEACDRACAAGYRVGNVDAMVLLEKPKIGPFREAILAQMHHGLAIFGEVAVNLKAGTNEGLDAIGKGEAIAAHVVVLLQTR